MICELLSRLETETIREAVREILVQAAFACEAGDGSNMLKLAKLATSVAVACGDTIGEAVSLAHVGVAEAHRGVHDAAIWALERAQRIFHRDPALEQRHNEGLALFGQALVHAMRRPRNRVLAIACYQKAVDLFEELYAAYEFAADNRRCRDIIDLVADLRLRMLEEIPQVYLDAKNYAITHIPKVPLGTSGDNPDASLDSPTPASHTDVTTDIVDGVGRVIGPDPNFTPPVAPAENQGGSDPQPGSFVRDDSGRVSYVRPHSDEPD